MVQAAYVDFYKAAGARVVPIVVDQFEGIEDLLSKLNGVVFPGGYDYNEMMPYIYKWAIDQND